MEWREKCKELIEVGQALYEKGLLVGADGNFSIRLNEQEMLITASGHCKGKLTTEGFTRVNFNGDILSGPKPARDIRMHLAVYHTKPEIKSVVHAHPPIATGLSMTKEISHELKKLALPEVMFNLRGIAVTEYCTPISCEVPEELIKAMGQNPWAEAVLLANHGALTMGETPWDAFYKMETLEMFAKTLFVSKLFGTVSYLDKEQTKKVDRLINGEDPDVVARS